MASVAASAQTQAWIGQFGTSGNDQVLAAAPDGSGGVYLGGETYGSLGGANAGQRDIWLARYDASGSRLWILQLGTSGFEALRAAAPDESGGVYVGGDTTGSLGGGPNAGMVDAWLAHYDGLGNLSWLRQIGTQGNDAVCAAASDGSSGVYFSGYTSGSLGGPYAGSSDAWLAHYDGAGNQDWIHQFGLGGTDVLDAAAPDGAGGVYVGGGMQPLLTQGGAVVARFDMQGNQIWSSRFGTGAGDGVTAAALDGVGGVYCAGTTNGSLGGPSAGSVDAWLARYDGVGNQLWIRQLGTSAIDSAVAVAPDGAGGVYCAGATKGDLGGSNAGLTDAWLAHYDSGGNQLWISQLGTSDLDGARAAASDGAGGMYTGGSTEGSLGGPSAGAADCWVARWDGGGPPSVYCTGKPSSLGCTPAIGLSGPISAGAGSGCVLSATNLLGGELGLFFHSTAGAQANPFHGGFLCVLPPIRRHGMLATGGTSGNCSGVLSEDLNTYIASGADPALVAGAAVWIQAWSRDPGDPSGDSLSDAVTTVICP